MDKGGQGRTDSFMELISMDGTRYLTESERWTLYDALKEAKGTFGEDVKVEILRSYSNELNEKYRSISDKRIIKKYLNIFNFDEEVFLKLYEAIDKNCCINVKLKEGIVLRNIYPSRIFLEDNQNIWYLEHIREGEPFTVGLNGITEVILLSGSNSTDTDKFFKENKKKMQRVKIRVFDEKNSRERAVGFLSPKYIIHEKISYGHSDITARIMNLEAFKKWVMEMTPRVIVLEPEVLRLELHERVNSWVKNYTTGI